MSANGDARLCLFGLSGLVTDIAANGVLFSFTNPSDTDYFRLDALDVEARTITGFAAAQEMALAAHFVSSDAEHTGGASLSGSPAFYNADIPIDATYSYEVRPGYSRLKDSNHSAKIATTSALAASGVPVINGHPFAWDAFSELATSATLNKGFLSFSYRPGRNRGQLIGEDAGFIIRAPIAIPAGTTIRLFVRALLSERVIS